MAVELHDLIMGMAAHGVRIADFMLRSLDVLYAGGAPDGLGAGGLAAGGAAAGAAGGAAAAGSGNPNRGFRYTGNDGTVYDSPSGDGTAVGDAPAGGRLVYDDVVRDARGTPTHYHVNLPGGPSGYIPAGNTSDTRPTVPPPSRPSVVLDTDFGLADVSAAQTAGSRG